MTFRVSFQLGQGSAEADFGRGSIVRLGDRVAPKRIKADLPSPDGQPTIHLRLEVVDGVPQCREIRIASVDGGREVKPLDLAAVKLNAWVEELFAAFTRPIVDEKSGVITMQPITTKEGHLAAVSAMHNIRKGKAARRLTRPFLERVAEVYRAHPTAPNKAIAATFGVANRTAQMYAAKARKAGLLAPTTPGKRSSD